MKKFMLGIATTMFFGAVLFGAFRFFNNIHRFGNSTYATVDECVLDKMRGQTNLLLPTTFRYCRSIVRHNDGSDLGEVVEQPTQREMTDEEVWGKSTYSNVPKGFSVEQKKQ